MQQQLDKVIANNNVTDNSSKVQKNDIFVAIKGTRFDGHKYIEQALENGASTIIIAKDHESEVKKLTEKYIAVNDTREALSYLAAKKYKLPKNIASVTGTDGKTSVAFFYKELLALMGKNAAAVGTMGVLSNVQQKYFEKYEILTTPGTLELYKILDELHHAGVDNICLEASSHGIDQKRLDLIPIKAAGFTSFGRDHLDYHKDLNDYLEAKLRLFNKLLLQNGTAIINSDMDIADKATKACGHKKVLTYGHSGEFIKIENVKYNNTKMSAEFIIEHKKYNIDCNLFGDFQVYNLACTLALIHATGHSYQDAIKAIPKLNSVPGRMQRVENFNIFIDYSHTPDSLQKALSILKHGITSKTGRIIAIFGCGGDRDKGKRALMGQIADKFSDIAIITDDNPRTEDPDSIRNEIKKHCSKGINIGGREKAIEYAIKHMKHEDALLIAGKGHETYQILADKTIDFNDYDIARGYAEKHHKK